MEELVAEFLALNARRWSPKTIDAYGWYLRDMARQLREGEGVTRPGQVQERMLLAWLDEHPGWSATTSYTAVVACRSFFQWTLGPEHSPARRVVIRRPHPAPPRIISDARLERILSSFDTATPKGRRDLALVALLLETGLRAAEVCRLQLRHVDMAARRLSVRRKGGKWKDAVFAPYVRSCLEAWIATRDRLGIPEEVRELFVAIGGKTPGKPLTTSGLRVIFRQMGERLGFHFSPHDFRRTFFTMLIRNGAPTKIAQFAGGLDSMRELERRYVHLQPEDVEPYSPASRLARMLAAPAALPSEES